MGLEADMCIQWSKLSVTQKREVVDGIISLHAFTAEQAARVRDACASPEADFSSVALLCAELCVATDGNAAGAGGGAGAGAGAAAPRHAERPVQPVDQ